MSCGINFLFQSTHIRWSRAQKQPPTVSLMMDDHTDFSFFPLFSVALASQKPGSVIHVQTKQQKQNQRKKNATCFFLMVWVNFFSLAFSCRNNFFFLHRHVACKPRKNTGKRRDSDLYKSNSSPCRAELMFPASSSSIPGLVIIHIRRPSPPPPAFSPRKREKKRRKT